MQVYFLCSAVYGSGDSRKESCADVARSRGTSSTGLQKCGTACVALAALVCRTRGRSCGTHDTVPVEHATLVTWHIRGTTTPHCERVPQRSPFYCPRFHMKAWTIEREHVMCKHMSFHICATLKVAHMQVTSNSAIYCTYKLCSAFHWSNCRTKFSSLLQHVMSCSSVT